MSTLTRSLRTLLVSLGALTLVAAVTTVPVGAQAEQSDHGAPGEHPGQAQRSGDQGPAPKVTLCHATGSETNPYVVITISENAVLSQAHPEHQGGEDRIPSFEGFEGQNFAGLTEEGLTAEQCAGGDDGAPPTGETPGEGDETPTPDEPTDVIDDEVGSPEQAPAPEAPGEVPEEGADDGDEGDETTEVAGDEVIADEDAADEDAEPQPASSAPTSPTADEERADAVVAGSQVSRTALPRTGADSTVVLAVAGFLALATGFGLRRMGTRLQAEA